MGIGWNEDGASGVLGRKEYRGCVVWRGRARRWVEHDLVGCRDGVFRRRFCRLSRSRAEGFCGASGSGDGPGENEGGRGSRRIGGQGGGERGKVGLMEVERRHGCCWRVEKPRMGNRREREIGVR